MRLMGRQADTLLMSLLLGVRENVRNNSENDNSHVFAFLKKNVKAHVVLQTTQSIRREWVDSKRHISTL